MNNIILGTQVHPTSYDEATDLIQAWAGQGDSRMVVFANVHMIMEAYNSADFQQIVNAADLAAPDGMPLVWLLRRRGFRTQQRVSGYSQTMRTLEAASTAGYPVGFYGSTPSNLARLVENVKDSYPGLQVTYAYSPPFRELTPEEDAAVIAAIRNSGVKLLFVSLGCPNQERWVFDHRGQIDAVMLGIGAAFEVLGGSRTRAPKWMRRNGLEWAYRLWQEPLRLWKRYLLLNPRFVAMTCLPFLRKHK